jgi:CheY-like chemotaxis protein
MDYHSIRPSVLLVDAEDAARHALETHLEDADYDVNTTLSGRDAIAVCEAHAPDIIIMDIYLPDMDGFEVCEHIRYETHDHDVTIIVMTEPNDNLTRSYLGSMVEFAGGDYYFSKPCDGKLIVQLLDDLTAEWTSAFDDSAGTCGQEVRGTQRKRNLALA